MSACKAQKLKRNDKDGFFMHNIFVIMAFLLPAAIMAAVFVADRFFPFGKNMLLVVDSWHQYYPFLAEYQRMLKEGASVFYSFNTGGGSNFLGVIGNYLGSPLYMLSYFVPSGTPWLQAFLAFTVLLRIGCAGGFSAIFFRKVFKRNDLSLVYFSLMYALCAFVLGYYWNMMWLDTVALLPLVAAGVISVLRDKKFALYIISLAMAVTFSFYMGYMVCLFVLILSVCYTIVTFAGFKNSVKNALKMAGYTLVAFMLTGFMTVPVFMALQASDSAGAVSSFPLAYTINYAYGYDDPSLMNTLRAILRTATNLLAFTKPIKVDSGEPNLACSVLALVLAIFYFCTGKIKLREKLVSGGVLVFFVLSCVINQLNYIWHGMSTPAMVYYRWTYIFSFVVIVLAYRAFTLIDGFTKKTFIFACALTVIYLGAAFLVQRKLSVAITAAAAVAIVVGLVLYRAGKMKYQVLSMLLGILVLCEMGLSAYYGVSAVGYSDNSDYPKDYEQVMTLLEGTRDDKEIFRTEFLDTYTLNDGDLYDTYGVTTFNSMLDSTYADFFAEAGLAGSVANNRYEYLETSPVINTLLNIKYLVARKGVTAVDTEYLATVGETEDCVLYINKAYIPTGVMVEKDMLTWGLHDDSQIPFDTQNELFSLSTGIKENVFDYIEPAKEPVYAENAKVERIKELKHAFTADYTDVPAEDGEKFLPVVVEYEIDHDGSYYGIFTTGNSEKVEIEVNGDSESTLYIDEQWMYVAAMGNYKKGDKVKVTMYVETGKKNVVTYYCAKLNNEVFDTGVDKLRGSSKMELTEWTDRGFTGTISVDEAGLFYTSVLYDEGFKAYVDGKEVEITPIADTLVAFELEEGEHTLELKFTPCGIYLGYAVTAVGLLAFIVLCVAVAAYRKKHPVVCAETLETQDTSSDTDIE